jgi:thioredoxin reductase (NADPH)
MPDIAVIGGGPAGLSAAINARQRNRSVLVLSNPHKVGWLNRAERVDNYPGLHGSSGAALLETMRKQALDMGAEFRDGLVRQVLSMGDDSFALALSNDYIEARRVILATGARQPALLPGEETLLGRGVSYCATCDGMLFRGKRIGVLGASDGAAEEANYLAGLAGEVLYFGKAAAGLDPRITHLSGKITAVLGDERVTGVAVGDQTFPLDGLFILRDAMALNTLLPGLAYDGPFIRVNRQMRTNLSGVFAAGDCTGQPLQVAKAVGEGCVAGLGASE